MTRYESIDSIIQKYECWSGDDMEPVCKNCAKELQKAGFGRNEVQEYFAKDGIYNEETDEGTWDKGFVDCIVNELPINSSFIVKRNRDGKYLGWSGTPENRSGNTIWVDDEKDATEFDSKEYIEKYKGALMGVDGLDNEFTVIESSCKITSSQNGFENVAEGTKYDDYHIDTKGMGILSVANIIEEIEGRGNQAVLTVQSSDGSTNHSQFGSKDWKEYKDSVNNAGNSITDVWVTEVEGGSYVRNSRRLVKSARYIATDPETGEVLGSADTYEEAVNEWGEDVTITDSEVGDGTDTTQGGILSSKESNYKFNQRIVNSVLAKEITEDDAIKQIASRNNMNVGFAKQILNNLLEDHSLIQSGVMEMADDINKDFDLNGDLYSWFDDYVEGDGKSTTVGGELVRAAHRIIGRFENDGDKIGMGYGKETVNPAARYILAICNDYIDRNDIEEMLYNESRINYSDDDYEAWLQQFERTFEDYLRNHEELFHAPNKNDMWDYKEEDDVDSSVTECCIYDDDGNEYWFQKDDIGWKCTNIEMVGQDPEYNVDDTFTSGDDFESEIGDRREPYGSFTKDGFTYSWEGVGEPDDEDEYREWIITDVSLEDSLANVGETWEADDLGQYCI